VVVGSVNLPSAAAGAVGGFAVVTFPATKGAADVPALVLDVAEISGVGFAMLRPERWNTKRQVQSKAIPATRSMGFFTRRGYQRTGWEGRREFEDLKRRVTPMHCRQASRTSFQSWAISGIHRELNPTPHENGLIIVLCLVCIYWLDSSTLNCSIVGNFLSLKLFSKICRNIVRDTFQPPAFVI
jgi:hypothetical protein